MVSALKSLNHVYTLASLKTYSSAFLVCSSLTLKGVFPQGATSQLQNRSKPIGTTTISVTSQVHTAMFQNLRLFELGRCFLQTSSLRDLELAPTALTKTWLRVEIIA
jgi:hypothetical protein